MQIPRSLFFRFRKLMVATYSNKWFDRVVLVFILLNCVVMALERPDLPKDSEVSYQIYELQSSMQLNPI